jgi:hypothetical protein
MYTISSIAEEIIGTNTTERITHSNNRDEIIDGSRNSSLAYPRISFDKTSTQKRLIRL